MPHPVPLSVCWQPACSGNGWWPWSDPREQPQTIFRAGSVLDHSKGDLRQPRVSHRADRHFEPLMYCSCMQMAHTPDPDSEPAQIRLLIALKGKQKDAVQEYSTTFLFSLKSPEFNWGNQPRRSILLKQSRYLKELLSLNYLVAFR